VTPRAFLVSFLLFPALGAEPAAAVTRHVPADHATIAAALAAAGAGDTVLVAPGTYAERVTLASGVVLRGAGAPGDAVIDATGGGPCVTAVDCAAGTWLEGFRLVGGTGGSQSGSTVGGALRVAGGIVRVRDCVFDAGAATFGGGSAATYANLVLERCTWLAGSAEYGGGHFQAGGDLTLRDVRFEAPHAVQGGALFATNGARVNVDGALVRSASAEDEGGAMRFDTSVATLGLVRFENNVAGGRGGAIAVQAGGQVFVTLCTLLRNHAALGGGAFHVGCAAATDARTGGTLAAADCARLSIARSEILLSTGAFPAAGSVTDAGVVTVRSSIVAGNASGLACGDSRATLDVACSGVYGNGGVDVSGSCAPVLAASNRLVDPHLCSLPTGDVGLCANSPLVDPGCGDPHWGSMGVTCGACGPTPAERASWGALKARYR